MKLKVTKYENRGPFAVIIVACEGHQGAGSFTVPAKYGEKVVRHLENFQADTYWKAPSKDLAQAIAMDQGGPVLAEIGDEASGPIVLGSVNPWGVFVLFGIVE